MLRSVPGEHTDLKSVSVDFRLHKYPRDALSRMGTSWKRFLAIEIYKPRKNWVEMNRMLDIAIARNPEQTLRKGWPTGACAAAATKAAWLALLTGAFHASL